MAFRFRRSMKIAPGVRLNFGKRGVSVSAGPRGASITAGRGGLFSNVGIPGTGLSVREKIGGSGGPDRNFGRPSTGAANPGMDIQVALKDDGSVEFRDRAGNPLPEATQRRARKEAGPTLESWLEQNCEHWNQGIREILDVHLKTPPPTPPGKYRERPFAGPLPVPPLLGKPTFLDRIMSSRRDSLEANNRRLIEQHRTAVLSWEKAKADHDLSEAVRKERFQSAQQGDPEALAEALESHLIALDWPRETSTSFEVSEDGSLWLDVDLPEIEDLPTEEASVAKRGLRITVKQKSDAQRRREYVVHVHAVAFRLVGEVFHLFPRIPRVVVSGFSQRPDPATGRTRDDYLYSAIVEAERWGEIDFRNLAALDLPECFAQFDLRRDMTKTGVFGPVEPFQS